MRAYIVAPIVSANIDRQAEEARLKKCNLLIADFVCNLIVNDGALFGVRHKSELSDAPVKPDLEFGDIEAISITSKGLLRDILTGSGDVNSGEWMAIRSLATCTSVVYGYDGQALLCLPELIEIECPRDQNLFSVEECSPSLLGTDWFDGSMLISGYNDFPET